MKFEKTETVTYDELTEIVEAMLPKNQKRLIEFSVLSDAGNNDKDQWLIKIPDIRSDKPVFEGTYNFLIDYWRVCSVAKMSRPIKNPTWKDIIIVFNELLQDGGSSLYLEGFRLQEDNIIEFAIGS